MATDVVSTVLPPRLEPVPSSPGSLSEFVNDPVACMTRLYRLHGSLSALEEDGQRLYFAFGPEFNQQILSDTRTFHARFFAIRGPRNSAQRRLTGALLSMNGEEHKRHRRLVSGPFQKKSVESYRDGLAVLISEMLDQWQPGQERDIFEDMKHYMLRVTSSILFGFDQPELAYEIGDRTERWVSLNHELGIGALVSDMTTSVAYDGLLTLAESLEASIRAMIDLRRSAKALAGDVLSLLIRAHDESGAGLTDAELIGQAAILFAAAHLTSANTLAWTLFLLAQHPEVAAGVADELQQVVGGQVPTLEQLENLPLFDQALKESMRVLPASAYSQRVATEPVQLGSFRLPRGGVVIFSQYMTHHLPELFPDPACFLPERWRGLHPSPYAYLPFAAGPRMCIGAPLAMTIFRLTLSSILQRWHFRLVPGADINGKVISTMLTPVSGMPMSLHTSATPFQRSRVRGNIHDLVDLTR